MIGSGNAELVLYNDAIIIHNMKTDTDKINELNLCKWIRKVNSTLFGDQDLSSSNHDCIYRI